jgi:hypothetical protein
MIPVGDSPVKGRGPRRRAPVVNGYASDAAARIHQRQPTDSIEAEPDQVIPGVTTVCPGRLSDAAAVTVPAECPALSTSPARKQAGDCSNDRNWRRRARGDLLLRLRTWLRAGNIVITGNHASTRRC